MTAARHADVVTRDPHPLVIGGGSHHPLEQLAVARLEIVLLPQGRTRIRNPIRKRIADPLEFLQPGDARLAAGGSDTGIDVDPGKGFGMKARKLLLEATYLAAQLGARETLVASSELP